jgi:hypothetical protein
MNIGMPDIERIVLQSIITCPMCGHSAVETMPVDACQYVYECRQCGAQMKPKPGHCCVYCSYGSVPCPPVQRERGDGRRHKLPPKLSDRTFTIKLVTAWPNTRNASYIDRT